MHQKDFVPSYFIWVKPGLQEKRAEMMEKMTQSIDVKNIDFEKFKNENKEYHDKYMKMYQDNIDKQDIKFRKAS